MDFLSLITLKLLPPKSDFLILNSLSFVAKNLQTLKEYPTVNLYLDNDKGGMKATSSILQVDINAKDLSSIYKGHKDVNEYLLKVRINTNEKIELKRVQVEIVELIESKTQSPFG